jgi:hypothetical protein
MPGLRLDLDKINPTIKRGAAEFIASFLAYGRAMKLL